MSPAPEPRNPFYFLLLAACVVFLLTILAYGLVPVLEDKAREAGAEPPPSPFREALRHDGWQWILYEVGVIIAVGLLAMWLDQHRRLQKEKEAKTGNDEL